MRGEIVDRDGVGFAVNDTGYKVILDRLSIDKQEENAVILGAMNLWTKLVVERLVSGIAEKTATWIPLK